MMICPVITLIMVFVASTILQLRDAELADYDKDDASEHKEVSQ